MFYIAALVFPVLYIHSITLYMHNFYKVYWYEHYISSSEVYKSHFSLHTYPFSMYNVIVFSISSRTLRYTSNIVIIFVENIKCNLENSKVKLKMFYHICIYFYSTASSSFLMLTRFFFLTYASFPFFLRIFL